LVVFRGSSRGRCEAALVKRDLRQVTDAARYLGMTGPERNDFGEWLEQAKEHGERGTLNARGDFTWDELIEQGKYFLAQRRGAADE
jgi:hypothetical protein